MAHIIFTNLKLMRKLSLLILIVTCCSFSKLLAQDWTFVCNSKDGKEKYYLKSTPVSNDGGDIKVWSKTLMSKYINPKNKKTYLNVEYKILYEFDCTDRKMQFLSINVYNASGDIIYSYEFKSYELEWKHIVPETIAEQLLDKACELFNN